MPMYSVLLLKDMQYLEHYLCSYRLLKLCRTGRSITSAPVLCYCFIILCMYVEFLQFRQWLKEEYGENSSQDLQEAKNLLSKYKEQAELQQSTGGRQWNNNFSSVPSLSYSNYTTET